MTSTRNPETSWGVLPQEAPFVPVDPYRRSTKSPSSHPASLQHQIFSSPHSLPHASPSSGIYGSPAWGQTGIPQQLFSSPQSLPLPSHLPGTYASADFFPQHPSSPWNQPGRPQQAFHSPSNLPQSTHLPGSFHSHTFPPQSGLAYPAGSPHVHFATEPERFKRDVFLEIWLFFIFTIPRQLYSHLLLRLPSLYFSRVSRIFQDAELSLPDIRRLEIATAAVWENGVTSDDKQVPIALANFGNPSWQMHETRAPARPSPNLHRFKATWEDFIETLMREWKTMNIISALLLSAILTLLQISAAASDPVTRTIAIIALLCALLALLYGCMYIVRFGTMRRMHKAASWAWEAQSTQPRIFWNVWVMLAMPAIWNAWSMLLFIGCIMSFVWRTGGATDAEHSTTQGIALGNRIAISGVLGLGVIYFTLMTYTFSRYGEAMDDAYRKRISVWLQSAGDVWRGPLPPVQEQGDLSQSRHYVSSPWSSMRPAPFQPPMETPVIPFIPPLRPTTPTDSTSTGNPQLSQQFSSRPTPQNSPQWQPSSTPRFPSSHLPPLSPESPEPSDVAGNTSRIWKVVHFKGESEHEGNRDNASQASPLLVSGNSSAASAAPLGGLQGNADYWMRPS